MLFRWVSERQARLTKIPMDAFDGLAKDEAGSDSGIRGGGPA